MRVYVHGSLKHSSGRLIKVVESDVHLMCHQNNKTAAVWFEPPPVVL